MPRRATATSRPAPTPRHPERVQVTATIGGRRYRVHVPRADGSADPRDPSTLGGPTLAAMRYLFPDAESLEAYGTGSVLQWVIWHAAAPAPSAPEEPHRGPRLSAVEQRRKAAGLDPFGGGG